MPQKSISVSASGDNTILDVATGDRNGIVEYALFAAGAVTAILKDEAGTVFGTYGFVAGSLNAVIPALGFGGERGTAVGDIILNLGGNVVVTGHIFYANRGK